MSATEHKPRAIALAEYLERVGCNYQDHEIAAELRRLSVVEEGLRSQHDADSRELRSLCAARDEARRERNELRAQVEALKVVANQVPWIQFPDTYADPFTYVIQHLNSNPYALTKDECVTAIKSLRSDFGIRGTPKVREDDILLQEAVWRIKDMLGEDDGHAFKEARKWLERYEKNRAMLAAVLQPGAAQKGNTP